VFYARVAQQVRTLVMVKDGEKFTVKQFHYTSWPDHGVPESTAGTLTMLRKAREARKGHDGPMLVHCSAGVGRTGTLLAVDLNIDRMAETGTVDVYGCLNSMRRQRNTVVQTEEQCACPPRAKKPHTFPKLHH
jgi:protein tyrosine phosphatase